MTRVARAIGWVVVGIVLLRLLMGEARPAIDPIPGDGFRVLIVYESESLKDYPRAQVDALYSADVRDYLDSKCVKGESDWPDYRILDQHADMTADAIWWQEAMKRPRQSMPWILIDSPQGGFEGPMPASVETMLELLKKYGEPQS